MNNQIRLFKDVSFLGRPKNLKTRFGEFYCLIEKAKAEVGMVEPLFDKEEEKVLSFMLCPDEKGYSMPNLQGCLPFPLDEFYELKNTAKPKSHEEFAMVVNLMLSKFKKKSKVIDVIKKNGLEMTISSVESFQRLLTLHEITESDAQIIIADVLSGRGTLNEWEELILESHEVPSYIIDQFPNIVSLPSESTSLSLVSLIIDACRLKHIHRYPLDELDPSRVKEGYVGPFFYIEEKILSKKMPVSEFDVRRRFFDVDTSHLALFESFDFNPLDGDYGNFPRGRVLYDNFHRRFVVYLDPDLNKPKIKEKIRDHFDLYGLKTVFRKDEHYRHDSL